MEIDRHCRQCHLHQKACLSCNFPSRALLKTSTRLFFTPPLLDAYEYVVFYQRSLVAVALGLEGVESDRSGPIYHYPLYRWEALLEMPLNTIDFRPGSNSSSVLNAASNCWSRCIHSCACERHIE